MNYWINKTTKKGIDIFTKTVDDFQSSKALDRIHHIQIIDRSGSMYSSLNGLIDNLIKTFDVIDDNDLISIIWFASPGSSQIFLKGARKSDITPKVFDKLRSTLGCTCFSEPINLAKTIIDDLSDICADFTVNLFTDGCPVVPWSNKEELTRCIDTIKSMGNCIAFNCIGYGNYYNFDFLKSLSDNSEYGSVVHSSAIDEYMDIFTKNHYSTKNQMFLSYTLETKNADDKILYIADNIVKEFTGPSVQFRSLSKNKNLFVVTSDYKISETMTIPYEDFLTAMYALAYSAYYEGRRKESLNIIRYNIGDRFLIDKALSAFTISQTGEYMNMLKMCIFDTTARYINGKVDSTYRDVPETTSTIDLLKNLIEMNASYYPYSKEVDGYKRTTRETVDNYNIFNYPENLSEISVPLVKLVLHKTRMNVSVLFSIDGTVTLNPKQAKSVGLPNEVKCNVFRTHSIISDGVLNKEKIHVSMAKDDYDKLNKYYVAESVVDRADGNVDVIFDLSKLPLISNNIGNVVDAKKLLAVVSAINYCDAEFKVLKHLYEKKVGKYPDEPYTTEQLEILEQHGIRKGTYGGVDNKREKSEDLDVFYVKSLNTFIKGLSSIPSVNAVIEKSAKAKAKFSLIDQYMISLLNSLDSYDQADIKKMMEDAKKKALMLRLELSMIKLFTILTGDWIEGLQLNEDQTEYFYNECDQRLVVKPEEIKEYI